MDTLTNKHGHILKYLYKLDQIVDEENIDGANVVLLYEGKLLL